MIYTHFYEQCRFNRAREVRGVKVDRSIVAIRTFVERSSRNAPRRNAYRHEQNKYSFHGERRSTWIVVVAKLDWTFGELSVLLSSSIHLLTPWHSSLVIRLSLSMLIYNFTFRTSRDAPSKRKIASNLYFASLVSHLSRRIGAYRRMPAPWLGSPRMTHNGSKAGLN